MTTPPDQPPVAVITLRDIYDRQVKLEETTASSINDVKLAVNTVAQQMLANEQHRTHVEGIHNDHESRLRTLERWKNAIPASVLTALMALVIALLEWATRAVGHG